MTPDFKLWVQEVFAPFGPVTVKRFFGGGGVYLGDTMFAAIFNDSIHLKADADTRAAFEAEGCEEFIWTNPKSKAVWNSAYFTMPAILYDDEDELKRWSRRAYETALKAKAARPVRKPRSVATPKAAGAEQPRPVRKRRTA
jgi:DNA transformation protein